MATSANKKTVCCACGKNNGRVRCEGCSKLFCMPDFNGNRQELGTQLDEIESTRDLFRQTLNERVAQPNYHELIEQIDAWENESIEKIRRAAKKARERVINHTTELCGVLEDRLKQLTEQLKKNRQEDGYFEPNLSRWKEDLLEMQNELTKPTNITIRSDAKPLITGITVDTHDQPNRVMKTSNNETIPCEICLAPIEWKDFDKACTKREEERAQRQRLVVVENNDGCLRCRYCDALRLPESMEFHERLCRNTNGGTNDPNYRGPYRLLTLSGNSSQPNP